MKIRWKKSFISLLILFTAFLFNLLIPVPVLADRDAVMLIDNDMMNTLYQFSPSPAAVFISDQVGYVFYAEFDTNAVYRKTTDGGNTWGSPVALTPDYYWVNLAVWYDRWTPGDTTGTKIHIAAHELNTDDIWYNSVDTGSSDNIGGWVKAIEGGSSVTTSGCPSITKSTDGNLFILGFADTWGKVSKSTTGGSSWGDTSISADIDDQDQGQLLPLSGGDVLLVLHDISANAGQSKVYDEATDTWDGSWTNIDTWTYNVSYKVGFGASLYKSTGDIYLAANTKPDGGATFPIKAHKFTDSGRSWSTLTNILATTGMLQATMAVDEVSGDLYAVYPREYTGSDTRVFYKKSTDGGTSWGGETVICVYDSNAGDGDKYVRTNFMSDERIYAFWYEYYSTTYSHLLGRNVASLNPLIDQNNRQTKVFLSAVDKTPSSTGSWVDVDVSGNGVPGTATAAFLRVKNTSTDTNYTVGLRNKDSTQDLKNKVYNDSLFFTIIGLDSHGKFQAYIENTATKIYLIGYSTDITVCDTWIEKTPSTAGSWQDIDCQEVPTDATGAIFWIRDTSSGSYDVGIKHIDSTDGRYQKCIGYNQFYAFFGMEDGGRAKARVGSTTNIDVYLIGYFDENFVFKTNGDDKSLSGTGTWTDIDLSGESDIGEAAFLETLNAFSAGTTSYGLRKNGSTEDITGEVRYHPWGIMGLDSDGKGEGYISSTNVDFYLVGYSKSNPSPPHGFNFFTNQIDKTPTSYNSWVDVDVSGNGVPEGATGVILKLVNTDGTTARKMGVRKKGSTDNFGALYGDVGWNNSYIGAWIGIDSNRKFQAYIYSTNQKVYLIGYTDSVVTFFTNAVDKTTGDLSTWVTVDCSSNIPSDATGVIIEAYNDNGTWPLECGVRKNGSSDTHRGTLGKYHHVFFAIGVDGSQQFQTYRNGYNVKFNLIGYTKSPVTFFTNALERMPSTADTWEDKDLTSDTSSEADGAIWLAWHNYASPYYMGVRKNGSTDPQYRVAGYQAYSSNYPAGIIGIGCGLDSGQVCELYSDYVTSSFKLLLVGYCSEQPTVIELASFTAKGEGDRVKVEWETATEIDNLGFNLYRSTRRDGPYTRLNTSLIPGLIYSITGRAYTYEDVGVTRGNLYYYKLEDLDRMGKRTMHGPACVDWDADDMPDDWEIAQGLNPDEDDAGFDYDEDGLSNYWEYKKRTDPFNPDTDGDGIPDGQDPNPTVPGSGVEGSRPQNGFRIIESDSSGMLIELVTPDFTSKAVTVSGTEYQKISIRDYIHGHTETVGSPQVPLKGLFIDLPGNASATLEVEDLETSTYDGYRVYPAPQYIVSDDDLSRISEVFELNQAVYSTDAFYPSVPVEVGKTVYFRDQKKAQLKFNPIQFNPVTGELKVHTLMRVRVIFDQPIAPMAMLSRIFSMASSSWSPNSSSPVYKVQVTQEGIYRLSYSYLSDQGVDVGAITDTRPIKLFHLGSEIPIYVSDGGDYSLDPGDYIEFYGEALNTKYTSTNVYWLVTDGEHGLRMEERDGSNGSEVVPTEFLTTIHKENDEVYIGTASGSDERDRWFDTAYVFRYDEGGYNISADIGLSLPDAADAAHAVPITLALEGYYNTTHLIDVSLNGNYLGQVTWDGLSAYEAEISADQAHLDKVTGQNTLTLSAVSDPDIVYVDWVEVEYLREFKAENNRLKFTSDPGAYRFTLQGFTPGSDVEVFDISDTSSVVRLTNFNPETFTLEDSPTQATTYMAMVPIESAGIVADIASDLSDTANRADYIIITHEDLYDAVLPLAQHRASKGLDVKVVKVEDIYDEFSYGISTPYAIKDFLSYAYTNWTPPAPTFVLIVGDSTYDYKDNLGLGTVTYVPTYLLVTEFTGETASDEWFVRISGDDFLSDMYIGRLPASTLAEAENMINRIIGYENTPDTNTWERHLYFVAGTGLAGGEEATFQAMNEDTSGISSSVYDISKTYGTTQDIDGALMVNYAGHGSATSWYIDGTNQGMDYIISYLNIAGILPFFVNMTCLNGYFIDKLGNPRSLTETLLIEADQGAIATLSSTGSTVPSGQWLLDYGLFEAIFDKDYRDLGRAISYAKAYLLANSSAQQDVANTFLLFGDPAMELKIPVPKRPTGLTATAGSGGIGLSWEANEETDLAGYNLYRSTTSGAGYEKVNSSLISGAGYQDGGISGDITYYYVVSAVDTASLESGYSLEASCTTGGGAASSGCFISSAAHGSSLGFGR